MSSIPSLSLEIVSRIAQEERLLLPREIAVGDGRGFADGDAQCAISPR